MVHGDADGVVGVVDGVDCESVAFCAHDEGEFGFGFELRVVEGD